MSQLLTQIPTKTPTKMIATFLLVFLGIGLLFVPIPANSTYFGSDDSDSSSTTSTDGTSYATSYVSGTITFDASLYDENDVLVTTLDEVVTNPFLQTALLIEYDKVTAIDYITFSLTYDVVAEESVDCSMSADLYMIHPVTGDVAMLEADVSLTGLVGTYQFSQQDVDLFFMPVREELITTPLHRVFAIRYTFDNHDSGKTIERVAVIPITLVLDTSQDTVAQAMDVTKTLYPEWWTGFELFESTSDADDYMKHLWDITPEMYEGLAGFSAFGDGGMFLTPLTQLLLGAFLAMVCVAILDRNSYMHKVYKSVRKSLEKMLR